MNASTVDPGTRQAVRAFMAEVVGQYPAVRTILFGSRLSTGIRIQPLPVWEDEWAHPELYSNPRLLHNIASEGIAFHGLPS